MGKKKEVLIKKILGDSYTRGFTDGLREGVTICKDVLGRADDICEIEIAKLKKKKGL